MKLLPILAALPSLLTGLLGCSGKDEDRLPGYVEGEFVYVSAPVSGKLQALHVSRGATVAQGAALFEVDAVAQRAQRDAAQARLAQAQASLQDARKGQRPSELDALQAQYQQTVAAHKLAEVELARQQKLLNDALGSSQQDVDRARATRDQASDQVATLAAQLKTARLGARSDQVTAAQANTNALQAQLEQAEWELSESRQSSPAAGIVSDTLYRVGEWVQAGRPIVALLPPGNIKVRTFVPETRLATLHAGDAAHIRVDGAAQALSGTISFISPRMEFTPPVIYSGAMRDKLVALVEIALAPDLAATLHPGQPVDVVFGK